MPFAHALNVFVQGRELRIVVRRSREYEVEDAVFLLVEDQQSFFEHRTEFAPELQVLLFIVLSQGLQGLEHLLDEVLPDRLNLAVLLKHFAGHVEGDVFRVYNAAHKAQIFGDKIATLIHDEDASHIELDTSVRHFSVVEVVGRDRRNKEQGLRFEVALHLARDAQQRLLEVVADVLVELFVFLVGHVAVGTRPNRLHRVQRFVCSVFLFGLFIRALFARGLRRANDFELDRIGDKVGILLHRLTHDPFVGEVLKAVVRIAGFERKRDGRSRAVAFGGFNAVAPPAVTLPKHRFCIASLAREHSNLVGGHEGGVEADAKLADQLGGITLTARTFELFEKFSGARLCERAEVRDHIVAVHPDAVVHNRERSRFGVCDELDTQLVRRQKLGLDHPFETHLVDGVTGVRDQFAEEHFFVGIERMDHQVEELLDLGLEFVLFGAHRWCLQWQLPAVDLRAGGS